jgi:hypothetical protein
MPETANPSVDAADIEPAEAPATEPIESVEDRLIDTVTATQQEAIDTIESAGQAMFDVLSRAQAEITDFVAERIRQDLDTQQAFLRCRSLDEVRDLQVNFLRTALDQYGVEAARLMRLGGEVAARSLDRARA